MGLRCLLGHDFTEPEIEKEREEDGREVVTTVREVKTCSRCGETQVVSENTEVTTIEQLTDHATDEEETNDDTTKTANVAVGADAEDTADRVDTGDTVDPESTVNTGDVAGGDGSAVAESSGLDRTVDDVAEGSEDDAVILDDEPEPAASDPASASEPASDIAPDDEDAELIDADDTDDTTPATPDAETDPTVVADETAETGDTEATADTETDDGVILDDDAAADDGERAHGAWPTDDESTGDGPTGGEDHTPWPEQRGEDEGFSAEVGGVDGDDVEFGGGLTPEPADPMSEPDPDTEYVEAPDDGVTTETGGDVTTVSDDPDPRDTTDSDGMPDDDGSGIARGESPDFERPQTPVASEYYCPACGMTMDTDGNSMRAGDICPECKRGYVDERPI